MYIFVCDGHFMTGISSFSMIILNEGIIISITKFNSGFKKCILKHCNSFLLTAITLNDLI